MKFRMAGVRRITERINSVDLLREQVEALEAAVDKWPGIAIDLAKSLIETTCKTIHLDLGLSINESWTCQKLVKETLGNLRLCPQDREDEPEIRGAIRDMVSGIVGAVNGLRALRNIVGSASHGRDAFSKSLDLSHALLAAQVADAVVGFLWALHKDDQVAISPERLLYTDNPLFNSWIDSQYSEPVNVLSESFAHSEVMFNLDPIAYKDALITFLNNWKAQAQDSLSEDLEA